MPALMIVLGLALLALGGQALVSGASSLARAFRVPPLIIGLTVMAYGTSAPELAVCLQAALDGSGDIALGNVLGSNICNILLILGLAALVRALVVERQLVRIDVPIMMGISGAALFMGLDGRIGTFDGTLLVTGAMAYTYLQIHLGRKEGAAASGAAAAGAGAGAAGARTAAAGGERTAAAEAAEAVDAGRTPRRVLYYLALVLAGIGLLVLGADRLVAGAVELARAFGVRDLVIGLTIVAAGTSMPEVAATIIAAMRKETAMAVGNMVGSNVFNLLAVLGGTALIAPEGVAVPLSAQSFDFPVMAAVALACLPVFTTGHCIARWEGALFLGYYLFYLGYRVARATQHDLLHEFREAFWGFVLPLTVITLGVSLYRHRRARAAARARIRG